MPTRSLAVGTKRKRGNPPFTRTGQTFAKHGEYQLGTRLKRNSPLTCPAAIQFGTDSLLSVCGVFLRRPLRVDGLSKAGLNYTEGPVELLTQRAEHGENDDRDQSRDHSIFHGGHARFIASERTNEFVHELPHLPRNHP